jgi:hypothetical protein
VVGEEGCEAEANALALALELALPRTEVVKVNDGDIVGTTEALVEPDFDGQDEALDVAEDETLLLKSAEALGREEESPDCEVNADDAGLIDCTLLLVGLLDRLDEGEIHAVVVNAAVVLSEVVGDGEVKGERESIVLGDVCVVALGEDKCVAVREDEIVPTAEIVSETLKESLKVGSGEAVVKGVPELEVLRETLKEGLELELALPESSRHVDIEVAPRANE